MTTQAAKPAARLLRIAQVIDRVGLKKTMIYDLIKQGAFPKPIKLGGASAWLEIEIESWILFQVKVQRETAA
jgi:prophage regulatory protein